MPRKELTPGSIFHGWTVVEKSQRVSKHDGPYWLCKCLCGTLNEVTQRSLIRNKSKSCGCQIKRPRKLDNEIALFNELKRKYYQNAKVRGLSLDLTDEDLRELFFNACSYCDQEPSNKVVHRWTQGFLFYSGIDRIDNNKPYVKDNCVSCCKTCNVMKNNLTLDDFLNHINNIAKKHPRG